MTNDEKIEEKISFLRTLVGRQVLYIKPGEEQTERASIRILRCTLQYVETVVRTTLLQGTRTEHQVALRADLKNNQSAEMFKITGAAALDSLFVSYGGLEDVIEERLGRLNPPPPEPDEMFSE